MHSGGSTAYSDTARIRSHPEKSLSTFLPPNRPPETSVAPIEASISGSHFMFLGEIVEEAIMVIGGEVVT